MGEGGGEFPLLTSNLFAFSLQMYKAVSTGNSSCFVWGTAFLFPECLVAVSTCTLNDIDVLRILIDFGSSGYSAFFG